MTAQFAINFRNRVFEYHTKNGGNSELTMEDAAALTSHKKSAADEMISTDDPMIAKNHTDLLRKVLAEDSSTWKAIRYLEENKKIYPGFDFRIKYSSAGTPEGLIWMTPNMRENLLRYGDILCLGMQARQYNSSGFPYCSPIGVSSERQNAQTSEALVVEESTETYYWILQSLHEMESRWSPSNLRIVFGDHKVSMSLMTTLGIQETCLLRGDYYHNMSEVFPKKFGEHFFAIIKAYLKAMMESKTEEEWTSAYFQAKQRICFRPDKVELLDGIYENPTYYSGYVLYNHPGSLDMKGDVAAEQNHSSVAAYLGEGAAWTIAENIYQLLRRHKDIVRRHMAVEDNLHSYIRVYKTTYQGYEGLSDMEAKQALPGNAYKRFFVKALESGARLQHRVLESEDAVVWKASEPWSVTEQTPPDDAVIICSGMRCPCHLRIAHNIQCAHEFCVAKKFELSKYQSRWYNKHTYAVHNPHHPRYNHSTNQGQDILTEFEDEDLDNNENPFDGISSNMVVDEDNEEPLEVTYPELLNLYTVLFCTVANGKKEKKKVN